MTLPVYWAQVILAEELTARARDRGSTVLFGWASQDAAQPYWPWVPVLSALVPGR